MLGVGLWAICVAARVAAIVSHLWQDILMGKDMGGLLSADDALHNCVIFLEACTHAVKRF